MDNWMKGLIAVACGVVILAGGAYGWDKYSTWREAQDLQERIASTRGELFRLAKAEPYEIEKVVDYCRGIRSSVGQSTDKYRDMWVRQLAKNCLILGYR